jgi:hypothetical protein
VTFLDGTDQVRSKRFRASSCPSPRSCSALSRCFRRCRPRGSKSSVSTTAWFDGSSGGAALFDRRRPARGSRTASGMRCSLRRSSRSVRVHFCARTVRDADWADGPRRSFPESVRLCRTGETFPRRQLRGPRPRGRPPPEWNTFTTSRRRPCAAASAQ